MIIRVTSEEVTRNACTGGCLPCGENALSVTASPDNRSLKEDALSLQQGLEFFGQRAVVVDGNEVKI